MKWPLVLWLAVLLGILRSAEAHQVNLVTARVALTADRIVTVELGLKGSDVDRLIGTRTYDAKQDAVSPAAVEAAGAAILVYFHTHMAVTGGGAACAPSNPAILPDGDGIIYRNSFACASMFSAAFACASPCASSLRDSLARATWPCASCLREPLRKVGF